MALGFGVGVVVVDGYDRPIRALHRARIAQVRAAAIIPQVKHFSPGFSAIGAQARPHAKRRCSVAVGQANPPSWSMIIAGGLPPEPASGTGRLR